jgi:GPI mannosyltransferase 1 subunit M
VLEGGTPYDRHTYRYTPLLAYLMTGNILLFDSFGKVLFSAFDVIAVLLMSKLISLTSKDFNDNTKAFLLNLWLLNPLTI